MTRRTRNDRFRAYLRGRLAEALCRWLLRLKGYRILECDYRTKVGEIDILATWRGWLIAAEVKVRAKPAAALEAVTWRQRRRIERTVAWYLRAHPRRYEKGIRFDVFAVAPWHLPIHIENAWRQDE